MDIDFWIIVPALCQEGAQVRWRDAVGQGNAQLAVIASSNGSSSIAGLLQGGKDARYMLLEDLPGTR